MKIAIKSRGKEEFSEEKKNEREKIYIHIDRAQSCLREFADHEKYYENLGREEEIFAEDSSEIFTSV